MKSRKREMHPAELEVWVALVTTCAVLLFSALVNHVPAASRLGFVAVVVCALVMWSTPCRDQWEDE